MKMRAGGRKIFEMLLKPLIALGNRATESLG